MDLSQKLDGKWGVNHRYDHNSIFQKMDLGLFYFDVTISLSQIFKENEILDLQVIYKIFENLYFAETCLKFVCN